MSNSPGFLHVVQAIHGDAFVMEFENKQTRKSVFVLVDGGPGQSYKRGTDDYRTTDNLFKLLDDLSTRTGTGPGQSPLEYIDTVVVTHDDEDHKNGIADLFRYLLQTIDKPPTGSWPLGLTLMSSGTPPIKQIWYNSQANLIQRYISAKKPSTKDLNNWGWLETSGPRVNLPKNGWFDILLENYNAAFPSGPQIAFNKDFLDPQKQAVTLLSRGIRALPLGTNLVRRGPYAFRMMGPDLQGDLIKDKLITDLIRTSQNEAVRISGQDARLNSKGGALLTSATKSRSSDYSAKNRSSIAFLAFDQDQKAAGKADSDIPRVLMLGDAAIASQFNNAEEFTIMKIAHHGSSHNNFSLPKKLGLSFVEIKLSEGLTQDAFRFFYYVKAKKYVISASPTEGSPNPHVTTLLGIYFAAVELRRKVDVYMTNEIPRNALDGLMFVVTDPKDAKFKVDGKDVQILKEGVKFSDDLINRIKDFDKHMKIWLLKSDVPYGSIPFNDSDPAPDSWWPITFKDVLGFAFTHPKYSQYAIAASAVNKAMRSAVGTAPPPAKKKKP